MQESQKFSSIEAAFSIFSDKMIFLLDACDQGNEAEALLVVGDVFHTFRERMTEILEAGEVQS